MITVTVRRQASTEYSARGAVVRIDVGRPEGGVRYRTPLPAEVRDLIESRLEDWRELREERDAIDPYADSEAEDRWMALKVQMRELVTHTEKLASALITIPVFEAYRQEQGYKTGWTFYRLADAFGYEIASLVMPKEE